MPHSTAPVFKRAVFLAMMTAFAGAVFAQNGVSLDAEIQNIEKAAVAKGISAVERHDALVRLARLRQLSGDIEGAAKNWLEAAAAIPGNVDDDALLACAYCLAAMGEWDRAGSALSPLLAKSARARFLDTAVKAVKTGDVSLLSAIASDPDYSQMKSQIYFLLWKISRTETSDFWRQRLAAEFPQSPEGRIATVGSAAPSPAVIVSPNPFWLLLGVNEPQPVVKSETASAENAAPTAQVPASGARLQTGLYTRRDNAEAQIANLKKAGFSPTLEQRGEKWAVVVPAGADQSRAIRDLKNAGFDSFPVK